MTLKEFKDIVAKDTDDITVVYKDGNMKHIQCGFYDKRNHIETGTIYDNCEIKSVRATTVDSFYVIIDHPGFIEYEVGFDIDEEWLPKRFATRFVFDKTTRSEDITEEINEEFFKWVDRACENIRNHAYSSSVLVGGCEK